MPCDIRVPMQAIQQALRKCASAEKAAVLAGFFKTGKGQYGEGDVFLGVTVPKTRSVAKAFAHAATSELAALLKSKIHEERLVALLILAEQYKTGSETQQKRIADFYLKNKSGVNNWDLVDLSADKILGQYLLKNDRAILSTLAESSRLWDRRIAIVATFAFIRKNQFADTLRLCDALLTDRHDLMHKACGWMLREVGKRDQQALEGFLKKRYRQMPRTMLRYAIERFPEQKRKAYLLGTAR